MVSNKFDEKNVMDKKLIERVKRNLSLFPTVSKNAKYDIVADSVI